MKKPDSASRELRTVLLLTDWGKTRSDEGHVKVKLSFTIKEL